MVRKTEERRALDRLTRRIQDEMRDTREVWRLTVPGDPETGWCEFMMDSSGCGRTELELNPRGGRQDRACLRAYIIMLALEIDTTRLLVQALRESPGLRELCGEEGKIPAYQTMNEYLQVLGRNLPVLRAVFEENLQIDFTDRRTKEERDASNANEACISILESLGEDPTKANTDLRDKMRSSARRAMGDLRAPRPRRKGDRDEAIRLGLETLLSRREQIARGQPATTQMKQTIRETILTLFRRKAEGGDQEERR